MMKTNDFSSRKRQPLAAINITPLVDVLLILLVIIMLASPAFLKRLPVDIPSASTSGPPVVLKSLTVFITKEGKIEIGGLVVSKPEMLSRITPTVSVELMIDKSVTYDKIAEIISEIEKKKPKEISLLVKSGS